MIIEIGVITAFCAMLCWGIGDFLIQRSVRKVGDVETLAFIGLIGSVGLLPFVLPQIPALFEAQNMAVLLFLGVVTFIAAILDFEALKKGKLSVVEVILELELPVTAFLGIYLLKEFVSINQLAGIAVVFIGITLIALKTLSLRHFGRLEKGVLLGVAAAIAMGLVNFITAFGAKQISPLLVVWAPWVFFTIFCLGYLYHKKALKNMAHNAKKYKRLALAVGIFDTLAWLFYAYALEHNNIAVITAITESYPAIAMGLGIWINKENIKKHQLLGAIVTIAASIYLASTL